MTYNLDELLISWLAKMGYSSRVEEFKKHFLSHPDHPGLISITDSLTALHIENAAAYIPPESLRELADPFIGFISRGKEEQFVYAEPLGGGKLRVYMDADHPMIVTDVQFRKLWTGLVVACERAKPEKFLSRARSAKVLVPVFLALLLGAFLLAAPSAPAVLHFLLSSMGLGISILIVRHELELNNGFADRFCSLTSKVSCDAVLNSKGSVLFGKIKLSDAGLVFFGAQFLLWLMAGTNMSYITMVQAALSLAAVPFCFFSVYYQGAVIKKWCPLCLGIVSILLVQALSLAGTVTAIAELPISSPLLLAPAALCSITVLWYLLKPVFRQASLVPALTTGYLTFRRNYHLFLPYFMALDPVNTSIGKVPEIKMGNPQGSIMLLLVSNPLCRGCISAHKAVIKLLQSNDDLQISIRFYVPVDNPAEPRTRIAARLMELYLSDPQAGVEEVERWYAKPSAEEFFKRHPEEPGNTGLSILQAHRNWCHNSEVYATPAVFINGKRFPEWYKVSDLEFFMEHLSALESVEKNTKQLA